jgi:DNA polymerase elongation subunit (family B)
LIQFLDFRVGLWYNITADGGNISIKLDKEKVLPADPVAFAFDIETTKLPLKFPDASHDQIMMISYVIDGQVSVKFGACISLGYLNTTIRYLTENWSRAT